MIFLDRNFSTVSKSSKATITKSYVKKKMDLPVVSDQMIFLSKLITIV